MYPHLRQYLQEVPNYPQAIEDELASDPPATRSDEIRQAHQAAAARVAEFLREEQLPYALVHYPEFLSTCPDCGQELAGAYWELNNPAGQGVTIPLKLYHRFVEHGQTEIDDAITNLSGTVLGSERVRLDFAGIRHVLAGIPLSPEVSQELAGIEP